ncbi:UNVERIFIED_CONTAM: hypothetical protein Slati_1412500 [Sesamum latifolium]|uniref:Uncharacterized protein n=1 Tax=Sesamum latifolium TaxID=2727402 RepID=A0AAW2X6K1_9LAMI
MTHKSEPAVLVGEASTSKVKGKGARRWKRKKGKGTAVTATASTGGAPPAARRERAKGRLGVLSGRRQMICTCIAKERGIRRSVHNSSPTQVCLWLRYWIPPMELTSAIICRCLKEAEAKQG